jgi:hypothetical protein
VYFYSTNRKNTEEMPQNSRDTKITVSFMWKGKRQKLKQKSKADGITKMLSLTKAGVDIFRFLHNPTNQGLVWHE